MSHTPDIAPYLVRNVSAADHAIAVGTMSHMKASYPGMLDENFEAAFAIMLALYVEHRELMGDNGALPRVMQNTENVKRRGGPQLRTGKAFTDMAITHMHAEQLAAEDFKRHS